MKTHKFLMTAMVMSVFTIGTFTSCEKDETLTENEVSVEKQESIEAEQKARPFLAPVARYSAAGGNSLHTYRVANVGVAFGRFEGRPFKLGIYDKLRDFNPPSGTRQLYFLLSPGRRDFVLTTSGAERNNLLRRRWSDHSNWNLNIGRVSQSAYIHTSGGSGRVKLHRFYGAAATDHLYTTNFQEGVRAGYKYEGVTGWVHR